MELKLAQFTRLKPDGTDGESIEVQFNPTEYTLNKANQIAEVTIPGLDSPLLQFVRGQAETLTMDLFFDSTDEGMGEDATSVTRRTDKFYDLIKIVSETHAPPILRFSWPDIWFPGPQRISFKCIVESVRQRYTLFSPQGVPLRATLTVALKEYKTLLEQLQELNLLSGDHTKAHVVQQGETLSRIAWQTYGDPEQWRRIADFNTLDDPTALQPGMILQIPPLT